MSVDKIGLLLSAAEFVDRRDREMEHGYASSLPAPIEIPGAHANNFSNYYNRGSSSPTEYFSCYSNSPGSSISPSPSFQHHQRSPSGSHSSGHRRQRTTSRPKQVANRSTHNELEKNRRAHLRTCLDKLKDVVPLGPDSSKHTTLGLLKRARSFIQTLENTRRDKEITRENLRKQQASLNKRLQELGFSKKTHQELLSKRRSVSESSSLSSESSHSSSDSIESFSIYEGDVVDGMSSYSGMSSTSSSPPSDVEDKWLLLGEPSLTGEIIGSASCLSLNSGVSKKGHGSSRGVSCDRYRRQSGMSRRSPTDGSSDGAMMASITKRLTITDSNPSLHHTSLPKINVVNQPRIRVAGPL